MSRKQVVTGVIILALVAALFVGWRMYQGGRGGAA